MKSDFSLAFNEILEERSLTREIVLDALAQALVSAYRRDANIGSNQNVEARIDPTGKEDVLTILLEKEVVDDVTTEQTEVLLPEARALYPEVQLGDVVMMPVQTGANFGRIAAQTAKQVILQRIREAERESLYDEFVEREGDLVTGTVQSVSHGALTISLGRAEAVMPRAHQIPGERYRPHDKIRAYVAEVKKNSRGPQIIVSRAHKNMLRRLLEYEVPEIYNGQVEIKNIAREAGHRSKVAVAALQEGVDPVGACVGMRGIRIQNIVKELSDEKIDVIEWNVDPAQFIGKALSPARVSDMLLEEDQETGRTATVIVPDDQLSLAIGREGQNARLAAKLTGWRIDIKSVSDAAQVAFEQIDQPPLNALKREVPDLIAEVLRIMEKKRQNRPIQPEEFKLMVEFVKMAERRLLAIREGEREEWHSALGAVRAMVPDHAFSMGLAELELDQDITRALNRLENVGDLMLRLLADEAGLQEMLNQGGAGEDAMEAIRYALDDLVIRHPVGLDQPGEAEDEAAEFAAETAEAVAVSEPEEALVVEEIPPALVEPEPPVHVEPEPVPPVPALVPVPPPAPRRRAARPVEPDPILNPVIDEEELRKKSKTKRRELIFDEARGEVVAKRRRKGSRARDWGEFEE